MQPKFKKSYKFAIMTSLYLTWFITLLMGVFLYVFYAINIWLILPFVVIVYIFSFFIIQYRVERFIYKHVKKIYDDLTILESSNLSSSLITTDMKR